MPERPITVTVGGKKLSRAGQLKVQAALKAAVQKQLQAEGLAGKLKQAGDVSGHARW